MGRPPILKPEKHKVMLVEDDHTMVSLLTTLLNMEGYQVCTPENHHMDSVLHAFRVEKPQIALVDVRLADGNGLDLVREIRLDPDLNSTRIIVSSGLNKRDEAITAGADNFIQKPFMADDLIKLIHATI